MIHEVIKLSDYFKNIRDNVTLTTYVPENFPEWTIGKKRKALLILPGGGYEFCSYRESEPVALKFMSEDIACFVLRYTCFPELKYPEPITEALAAVAYIRRYAEKYHVLEDSISVIGFSAGGHLAATVSCYYDKKEYLDVIGVKKEETKIDGCILGYPVISKDLVIESTMGRISNMDEELLDKLSIDKHVTTNFPKTFIWTTCQDQLVPPINSIELCKQLVLKGVFVEFHMYPWGGHGGSVCDDTVYNDKMATKEDLVNLSYNKAWIKGAARFIKEYC